MRRRKELAMSQQAGPSSMDKKAYQLVKVYVRQRPFTKQETENHCRNVIQSITPREIILKSGLIEKKYHFDEVFGSKTSQKEIYQVVVSPLVDFIISGYNCTVFAYGQTGTGKTHTMVGGNIGPNVDFEKDPSIGIIPRVAAQLFAHLSRLTDVEYTVRVSFIEIYNEEVRDLLNSENSSIRVYDDPENKGSVLLKEVRTPTTLNTRDVYEWLKIGLQERQTAATNLNRESSRSHTLFTIQVNIIESVNGGHLIKAGKLHLVDLAGSENVGRSGATEQRAREAGTINKSLLTIGKVIKALVQKAPHVPYRDSKLTRILQDSLGGKTKTCMIATISPTKTAWDETISTLEYAQVARSIANSPQINVKKSEADIVSSLHAEMQTLRDELAAARTGEGFYVSQQFYNELNENLETKEAYLLELRKQLQTCDEMRVLKEEEARRLNESFIETRNYLETTKEQLQQKNKELKQKDYLLSYLNDREKELSQAAKELLKVCETSTKHERIYHSKYKNLSDSTIKNAQVAQNVLKTAETCIKEIQNNIEKVDLVQNNSMTSLLNCLSTITEVQTTSTKEISNILAGLDEAEKQCVLNFDQVVSTFDGKYSEKNLVSYYNCIKKIDYQWHQQFRDDVDKLILHIGKTYDSLTAKITKCLDLLSQATQRDKELRQNCEKLLADSTTMSDNNLSQWLQVQADINRINSKVERAILQGNSKDKPLLKQFADQLQTFDNNSPLTDANEVLLECNSEHLDSVKTKSTMLNNIQSVVEQKMASFEAQVGNFGNNAKNYMTGFVDSVKDNLTKYNTETKAFLTSLKHKTDTVSTLLQQRSEPTFRAMSDHCQTALNSQKEFTADIKVFVEQNVDKMHRLESELVVTAHTGDTPAKQQYDYPKSVKSGVPNAVLLEQFNMIQEDEEKSVNENR